MLQEAGEIEIFFASSADSFASFAVKSS